MNSRPWRSEGRERCKPGTLYKAKQVPKKLRLHYCCMNYGDCTDKLPWLSGVHWLWESDTAAEENARFPFTKKGMSWNWNFHATPVFCLAIHFESGTQIKVPLFLVRIETEYESNKSRGKFLPTYVLLIYHEIIFLTAKTAERSEWKAPYERVHFIWSIITILHFDCVKVWMVQISLSIHLSNHPSINPNISGVELVCWSLS